MRTVGGVSINNKTLVITSSIFKLQKRKKEKTRAHPVRPTDGEPFEPPSVRGESNGGGGEAARRNRRVVRRRVSLSSAAALPRFAPAAIASADVRAGRPPPPLISLPPPPPLPSRPRPSPERHQRPIRIEHHKLLRSHPMPTSRDSSIEVSNSNQGPDHLIVLVHGIMPGPSDWTYGEALLKKRLGDDFFMYEEMIRGLQRVSWKKVDVNFHASLWPYSAHNNMQVKNEWLHNTGADVIAHVVDSTKQTNMPACPPVRFALGMLSLATM